MMNSVRESRCRSKPLTFAVCVWLGLQLDAARCAVVKPEAPAAPLERRLYVADKSGLSVYDINQGHKFIRKIELPDSGEYKGICASPSLGKLYITSNKRDELICLEIAGDSISWRRTYGKYVDSMAITPDGKTIYLPCRYDGNWWVLNAADGEVWARIETGRGKQYDENPIGDFGPHNTWCNPAGTRMYLEVLTMPYVFIADTATHKIVRKVGPFSRGVRPFTVTDDEKYLFANVDGLLGFEVGDIKSGKVIHRVEAQTPSDRIPQIKNPTARKPHSTPSHGINLRPDQKEIWVVDGVHGYVFVYDATVMPPKHLADVPIFANPDEQPKPGWISFSLDGKYAYPDAGAVINTQTKKVVARIPTSEKLIEIDFLNGKPVKAGHR
ncbi:MAG: YncE family protein [Verrucomicrobia bacterium]|nr:YncE family protein [Verrucomicrobiota bacterium]